MPAHTYHHQKQAIIPAQQAEVFAYLDDQTRLAVPYGKAVDDDAGSPDDL